MKTSSFRAILTLGLTGTLLGACGGSSSPTSSTPATPTAPTTVSTPATPTSYDGTWTSGSQGGSHQIQFVVRGNMVVSFSIILSATPQMSCTNTITVAPNAPVAGSAFSFSINLSRQPGGFTGPVAATYTAQTAGSVTLGSTGEVAYSYSVQCGTSVMAAVATRPLTIAVSRTGS